MRPRPSFLVEEKMILDHHLLPTFVSVSELNDVMRDNMYRVFARYYDETSRTRFESDLLEKCTVLLLNDIAGTLRGFSTIQIWDEDYEDQRLRIFYSGDTIIESEYWGSQALSFNWIYHAGQVKRAAEERRLFWFLIVKGHRTYRYLPSFAITFYPDWRVPHSAFAKGLADRLASRKFRHCYNPETGVVSFDEPHGQLASAWSEPGERQMQREDVRYFLTRNPGYRKGDELVCLCELNADNLRPIARRVFLQGYGI